ncbi:hypothetical protein [Agilicoccus flavus]|uniref:hypothetical protein n=1 Tax=Agilicoccus flavus TaxID=2775968 RepID=UPI001CF60CC7|nr:hypothetical protein [Agilicoccus flavus]
MTGAIQAAAGPDEQPLPNRDRLGRSAPESFDAALRCAVEERGLTLDRLRHHLAQRGHHVSIATLSHWQTGRSRPVRGASLAALAELERVLDLPRGALKDRLVERTRSRAAALDEVREGPQDDLDAYFRSLCEQLGLKRNDGYLRVGLQDRLRIRPDRTLGPRIMRDVLRATRDGFDRFPVVYHNDEPEARLELVPLSNARLGRVIDDAATATLAAEVVLPRPLNRGESIVVELELRTEGTKRWEDGYFRSTDQRTRLFFTEVAFTPEDLPIAVEIITQVGGRETLVPAALRTSTVTLLLEDFGPGIYGLQWRWA